MKWTHPSCTECCELGRCHWCLTKPGPISLHVPGKGIFRACEKHAAQVSDGGNPFNRYPRAEVVGYEGSFRPIGLTINEEAAQRASVAVGYGITTSDTPATLR